MSVAVKICGLNDRAGVDAACHYGAKFVGFVFYPPSPRAVTPEAAASLTALVPANVQTVGLFVNPTDEEVARTLRHAKLNILQLHGDETAERVAEIKARTKLPIIKAIKVGEKADLAAASIYSAVADWLLFDAKVPDAKLPGGNARSFDWAIMAGFPPALPWFLAGGLNINNIDEAVRATGASLIDVSSGVEDEPGHKNPSKIRALLEKAAEF